MILKKLLAAITGKQNPAELRVELPTGEKGTVESITHDGLLRVTLDGNEDKQKYMGDPEKTEIVYGLLGVPHEERDDQWGEALLANLADANMDGGSSSRPVEMEGPDGFPYICLSSPEPNKVYRAWVIRHILPNLLEDTCGVVINPGKGQPDWVLSFGDIVNFHLNGAFRTDDDRFDKFDDCAPASEEVGEGGESVLEGDPSPDMLPPQVRAVLRRFLEAYDFPPKVKLMHREAKPEAGRKGGLSLIFPFTEKNEQDAKTIQYVSRAVRWFLPRHYSVLWMRGDEGFYDL